MKCNAYRSLLSLFLLVLPLPVYGVEYTWKSATGNWNNPANWTPAFGPPNAGDAAVIANFGSGNYQVNLSANVLGALSPDQISLGNKSKLLTSGYQLNVNGPIHMFNQGALLDVTPVNADAAAIGFEADEMTIDANAVLRLLDGRVKTDSVQLANGVIVMSGDSRLQAVSNTFIGNGSGSQDSHLTVFADADARILGPVRFQSDANVSIANKATLTLANATTFYGGGHYTGNGLLRLDGATTVVQGNTTIDMPTGFIDLDGTETPLAAGQTLVVNADFTVNALMIDAANNSFGSSRLIGEDIIQINNWGKLGITLSNDNTSWTMNGHLDINAVSGQILSHNISGSTMFLTGTAHVSGNSGWSARTEVAGQITIATDSHLRFSGGDLLHPNLMSGGTIEGPGTLGSLTDQKLAGHGTIHSKIQFLTNSELRADNGTLTLGPAAQLLAVGTIGTDDNDGILDVQHAWNTDVAATALELNGGQVIGADLVNGGTTRGFGRIAPNSFVNQGLLQPLGGELVIDSTANPDLDGGLLFSSGDINASQGDLRVTKPLSDVFNSSLTIGPGHRATFEQGWTLAHSAIGLVPSGSLHLNGGAQAALAAEVAGGLQQLAGIVNVDGIGAFHAPTAFQSTVHVNLPGAQDRLQLFEPASIQAGAFFAGNGTMENTVDNTLTLLSGAQVGVALKNLGQLELEDPVADAQVRSLHTVSTSRLDFDIRGKQAATFDTLVVQEHAQLSGTLAVTVNDGSGSYLDPATRGTVDAFALLTANSRGGHFSQLVYNESLLPVSFTEGSQVRHHVGDGLFRIVNYRPNGVQLLNYLALTGDANGDGSFNSGDLVQVFQAGEYEDAAAGNSDWTEGDWNGDGDFGSADFIDAFQQGIYEQASVLPATRAVPEPGTLTLLSIGGLIMSRRRRQA